VEAVTVESAADVAAAVDFVREHNLRLLVWGGGHSYLFSSSDACIGSGPRLVVEVKYLAWPGDNLLRQVVYEGLREDKPATEVRREMPRAK
jgi:hypothetical protein